MSIDNTFIAEGVVKYGDGHRSHKGVLMETITVAAAASGTLTKTIPAHSRITAALMVFDGAITLASGTAPVKVGLGISGNPDSVLLSGTTMTDGTVTEGVPLTTAYVSSETAILVASCNTSGAADGTMAGTVLVQIHFETYDVPA